MLGAVAGTGLPAMHALCHQCRSLGKPGAGLLHKQCGGHAACLLPNT